MELWAVTLLLDRPARVDAGKIKVAVAAVFGDEVAAAGFAPVQTGPVTKHDFPAKDYFLSVESVLRLYPTIDAIRSGEGEPLDPEVKEAFGNHRCFLAISVIPSPRAKKEDLYALMGKLAARFLDDTCVCVYCRGPGVYLKPADDVTQAMRGEGPKSMYDLFVDRRAIGVPKGEPAMEAAMAEAKRRWPEYLQIWKSRPEPSEFMIKARFETDGHVEFMWIKVASIDDDLITGILGNTPHFAKHLREGQAHTVSSADVVDWAYAFAGKGDGWFTEPRMRALVTTPK